MNKKRLERVTIFRVKDNVDNFALIPNISTDKLPNFRYKSSNYNISGIIKYCEVGGNHKTELDYPWLNMVNDLSTHNKIKFSTTNKTPSAVLGIKIKKDNSDEICFLVTFGMHTSRFIRKDKLISDFGIKVAMNICDQKKLKKVDTTTHSTISTLTGRQTSRGASLDVFDIDSEKEFFRSISGLTYENHPFIKSFSGKNSITVNINNSSSIDKNKLIEILLILDLAYKSEDYKEKFPTYGKLDYVSDIDEIKNLDNIIFEKIKKSDFSGISLAPSIIESDENLYYTYKDPDGKKGNNTEDRYDILNIEDLVSKHNKLSSNSSIQTIKNWRIYTVSTSDEIDSMEVYDCLDCEISYNKKTYILNSGIWRCISSEFKYEVENYIRKNIKEKNSEYLPNDISIYCIDNIKGEEKIKYKEEVYNKYVASNCDDIVLFDKSKIKIAGNRQYEICDLLHLNKEFIHVKVLKNGSSSLSHLFIQAKFYTDAFIKDTGTRSSMRDFLNNHIENKNKFLKIIPESREQLHAPSYSVVLCILTFEDKKTLDRLPFMVRYELAKTHKYLIEERGVELFYAIRTVTK